MIAFLAAGALLASGTPAAVNLSDAAHALEANRLVQARRMLADAIASGQRGPDVDHLLADLAFADQRWAEAQARYTQLLEAKPNDARSAERAGIATLMVGDLRSASIFIRRAISFGHASWQGWNALGVLCDLERDWDGADAAYATADELSPDRAEVLNNHGWSLILRGEWAIAAQILEKAAQLDPKSSRIANNLDLARAAVESDLPKRRKGETDSGFAARLNDAGVAAEQRGDRARAIAAFSRALAVSDAWNARAANNLARLQPQ